MVAAKTPIDRRVAARRRLMKHPISVTTLYPIRRVRQVGQLKDGQGGFLFIEHNHLDARDGRSGHFRRSRYINPIAVTREQNHVSAILRDGLRHIRTVAHGVMKFNDRERIDDDPFDGY